MWSLLALDDVEGVVVSDVDDEVVGEGVHVGCSCSLRWRYMRDLGVVSSVPVSSHVLSPERIIGHAPYRSGNHGLKCTVDDYRFDVRRRRAPNRTGIECRAEGVVPISLTRMCSIVCLVSSS